MTEGVVTDRDPIGALKFEAETVKRFSSARPVTTQAVTDLTCDTDLCNPSWEDCTSIEICGEPEPTTICPQRVY